MTHRFVLAVAAVLVTAATASAQTTMTASPLNPSPGAAVTAAVTGTAGDSFAVIGSTTSSGFSYAGVSLSVGTDVTILGVGVLNGSGQGAVSFTPPFPARDRFYVQVVSSPNGFATIVAGNAVTLVNNQEARLSMPIGGAILADGTPAFLSPGVTVSKVGLVYTINHPGLFDFFPVPSVTVGGNATITDLSWTGTQTVVTLSAAARIAFTIQPIRR